MKTAGMEAPIIVIGMHRSGTTMFTRALMDAGIFMGVDLSTNSESYFFTACNEHLLEQVGATWHDPHVVSEANFKFDRKKFWIDYGRVRSKPWNAFKLMKSHAWGWKDPRNTFTLPYWIAHQFPRAKMVHVHRNGIEVAQSLQRRNQILKEGVKIPEHDEFSFCFRLWERYLDQAFSYKENSSLAQFHVAYEDLVNIRSEQLKELDDFLGTRNMEASLKKVVRKDRKQASLELTSEDAAMVNASSWMQKLGYASGE